MPHEVFVDSGAWIAVTIASDSYHLRATETYRKLLLGADTLVTSNLAVAESYTLMRRAGGHVRAAVFLRSLRGSHRLKIVYANETLGRLAEELLSRYADQDFSYVDAVSFAIMHERQITRAFAFDRHFMTAGFEIVTAPEG